MKIFVDCHVLDAEFQGSRTYIKEIYNSLINAENQSLEIYLAAYDIENLKKNFPDKKNVHFIQYKSKNKFYRLGIEIPKLLKFHKIDYAHFQYIIPIVKPCKFIVTIHDVIFLDYPKEFSITYTLKKYFLYRYAAKHSNIVTTVSSYSKKSISKYFNIDNGSIKVISNAINKNYCLDFDIDTVKNTVKQKYGFNKFILYVSRIEPRKNHAFLLRAYLELELYKQGIHLVFIGVESIECKELKKVKDMLNDENKAYFHHFINVQESQLVEFYRASDLCVYISKGEGFGIPPLESGVMGKPTLCSNSSSMEEFDFFGDRHINGNSYEEVKAKISYFFQNGYTDESLLETKHAIKEKYSWEKSAKDLLYLIEQDSISI